MASLVFHAGALGDFITTLPAIGVWRRLHVREAMALLGKPRLVECAPFAVDAVHDAESAAFAPLFHADFTPTPFLERFAAPFSSALLFSSPSSPLAANLGRLGIAEILRQDPFPPAPVPIVDFHLSLFPPGTVEAEERIPRVACAADVDPSARAAVALHPGSGSARKNWPFERFLELARRLEARGLSVAWIVGPAETAAEERTALSGARLWRSLPLPALAALLRSCGLFVGNDSGVAHLAAASGCPTIALFGGSDPLVWAPRGGDVTIIQSRDGTMEGITVDEVDAVCRVKVKNAEA